MKKRLIVTLLALYMVLGILLGTASAAETSGSCGNDAFWNYDDTTATLTITGSGAIANYDWAGNPAPWSNLGCKKIIIEHGITSLGMYAFVNCSNITDIYLSDTVVALYAPHLGAAQHLERITIDEKNESLYSIDGVAFSRAGALLRYPPARRGGGYVIPDGITTIDNAAFANCKFLTQVVMPDTVKVLRSESFGACGELTSIYIPASLTNVDGYAFEDCSKLKDVYYAGSADDWSKIYMSSVGTEALNSANIHYNSSGWKIPAVTYDLAGGIGETADECWGEGQTVSIVATEPSKTGHVFKGWSDGSKTYQPGDTFTMPAHDVTLTAIWEIATSSTNPLVTSLYPANGSTFDHASTSGDKVFHITFDREVSNAGGNRPQLDFSVGTLEVHKASDDSVVYQVTESPFTPGVSSDVSLYGSTSPFKAVSITGITSELDYDTEYYVTMPAGFIRMADGIWCPAINQNDWKFRTIHSGGDTPTEPCFAVTYLLDGGTGEVPAECYLAGEPVGIIPEIPTKDGCIFKGWSDGSKTYHSGETFTMPAHDVTLTAVWEIAPSQPDIYHLTYDFGDFGPHPATNHLAGETITVLSEAPKKEGYKFGGWRDGNTTYHPGDTFSMPARDVTLKAIWVAPSLIYDLNGGQGAAPGSVCLEPGTEVIVDSLRPTRDGYDFVGWADGSTIYQPGDTFDMPGRDVTLKATWLGHLHTITYKLDGGIGNIPLEQHRVGDTVTVTAVVPSKDGCRFSGWSDGNGTCVTFEMPDHDIILTAMWSDVSPEMSYVQQLTRYSLASVDKEGSKESIQNAIYDLLFRAQFRPTSGPQINGVPAKFTGTKSEIMKWYPQNYKEHPYKNEITDEVLGSVNLIESAKGCMAYTLFATNYIYGTNGNAVDFPYNFGGQEKNQTHLNIGTKKR